MKRTDHEPKASASQGACGPTGDLSLILEEVAGRFEILKAELRDYVAGEVQNFKRGLRRFAVNAVLGISGALGAVAIVVTSIVFCLAGLAGWLGDVTGRPWLGSLLAGLFGIASCAGVLLVARAKLRGPAPTDEGES